MTSFCRGRIRSWTFVSLIELLHRAPSFRIVIPAPAQKVPRMMHIVQTFQNGAATTILVGDSATLIGWVPIYTDHSQLPSYSCLREQWERGDKSIPLLLSTGNNRPNNQLDGPGELLRFLNSKDFRAVISDRPADAIGKC